MRADPGNGDATVTGLIISAGKAGETHLLISFNQILPQFSVVANDVDRPVIGFADTVRGSGVPAPAGVHGLVSSVQFSQRDAVLNLTLVATGPVHVETNPIEGRALDVVITPLRNAGQGQPSVGAVGAATQLPAHVSQDPGADGFEVVFLKYADISEVVGLLTQGLSVKSNDTFVPEEPNFGAVGATGGSVTPSPSTTSEASTDAVGQSVDDTIGVDRRLNAIILKGSPDRIARLKEKIAEIDVPVKSVLLETIFVELDESGARNVGLNFNNSSNQIAVATFQTGAFEPSGFLNSSLSSVSLQAAIYAQVQAGHGKIVSRPRISAQSGSTAKIITGDALPILTSIALSGVNAVQQQVQYVNVGVTLQIAPRVSDDGFVTSHVFCVVSSVTGTSQGYPTISQREAETSATVLDGETFVIGGLTEESDIKSNTRVPILGSLPGVGDLFKLDADTRAKTELYIVVTPHVVRRGDPVPGVVTREQTKPAGGP